MEALFWILVVILILYIVITYRLDGTAPGRRGAFRYGHGAPTPPPNWKDTSPRPVTDVEVARLAYFRKDFLLSRGELTFCRALTRAIPRDMVVFSKVRVADLINCSQDDWKVGGFRISTRHVDFVIAEGRTTKILVAIELDDRTHFDPARMDRDYLIDSAFATANLPLLRIPARADYDTELLWAQVRECLQPTSSMAAPPSTESPKHRPTPAPRK